MGCCSSKKKYDKTERTPTIANDIVPSHGSILSEEEDHSVIGEDDAPVACVPISDQQVKGESADVLGSSVTEPGQNQLELVPGGTSDLSVADDQDQIEEESQDFIMGTEAEAEDTLTRVAIRKIKGELAGNVQFNRIILSLYSKLCVSDIQYQKLQAVERNEGEITAVGTLLNWVVANKVSLSGFMEVMEVNQKEAYDVIKSRVEYLKSEEGVGDLEDIQNHLRQMYRKKLATVQPIPGEKYKVYMEKKHQMMQPDFTAEELDMENGKVKDCIEHGHPLNPDCVRYETMTISELQDMFETFKSLGSCKLSNVQPNLGTLTGDPGVGKTTAVQRLAWLWARGQGDLADRYKVVFFIPIRKVTKGTLKEVLTNLKLLPEWFAYESLLLDKLYPHILFILDGVDENDITTEMQHLIEGKLFPGSTILMTTRPEAPFLQSLTFLPRVKITLLGTDKATVEKYLKQSVSRLSKEEQVKFEESYREKLLENSLLCIPLYLTLLSLVLKEHMAPNLTCTNLKVPQTSTDLFNSFMHVLISRWMDRMGKTSKQRPTIYFERSPLEKGSRVPGHVKRTLYFIGKLCYFNLIQGESKQEFSEDQTGEYLIDMEDIKNSGLFTIGKCEGQEVFFLKHKQLQEYLAALYLAYEGTKEPSFQHVIQKNEGKSLAKAMRDSFLIRVVQFSCGLSDKFYQSLLSKASSQFCIIKSNHGQIDCYYEASLFAEQQRGHLSDISGDSFKITKQYFTCCQTDEVSDSDFNFLGSSQSDTSGRGYYQKCLHKLTSVFDNELSVELLSRLYDIKLTRVAGGQAGNYTLDAGWSTWRPSSQVCHVTLCLDQLQTELLNGLQIKGVQKVNGGNHITTSYVDISGLLNTFPDNQELDIKSSHLIPYRNDVRSDPELSTPLTSLKLFSSTPAALPLSHCHALVSHHSLRRLDLSDVSMLASVCKVPHSKWEPQLKHLTHLTLWDDFSAIGWSAGSALCDVLQSCSHTLQNCRLKVYSVPKDSVPQIGNKLKTLKQLKVLGLRITSTDNLDCTADILAQCVGGLMYLHTLSVWEMSVQQHHIEPLTKLLSVMARLRKLELGISGECDDTGKVLLKSLPGLTKLQILEVGYDRIRAVQERLVETVCEHKQLRSLVMSGCKNRLPGQLQSKLEYSWVTFSDKKSELY